MEADNLIFQLDNFSLAIDQLGLLVFQVIGLRINELVEVVNSGQLFRDIVLEGPRLGSEVRALLALKIVLIVKLVDLLGILAISLS